MAQYTPGYVMNLSIFAIRKPIKTGRLRHSDMHIRILPVQFKKIGLDMMLFAECHILLQIQFQLIGMKKHGHILGKIR